jgi:TRAP-type mannitol/chloroaromatic compound transport system substrate-binding protein
MDAIRQANSDLLAKFAAKDPETKEILDSITDYQKQVRAWTNFADKAYLNSDTSN